MPSCQRTVAFEKACVLFNIGALYTQLGARQDRQTARGLDQAVDAFLRAAGTFTYICDNFTNAPSMDLGPHMLQMLVQLMLVSWAREASARAGECRARRAARLASIPQGLTADPGGVARRGTHPVEHTQF